jgi:hypothetical protein
MNAAQRRAVEALKAEALAAAQEIGRQTHGRVDHMSDEALATRIARRHRIGFELEDEFVPLPGELTTERLIELIGRKAADRAGMSYEDYMALSEAERVALGPKVKRPAVRPSEWRYSDRGE